MSKLVLELEYDFDFFLLGVSSHVANYRLAWGMNQQFELDLERVDDIDLSFGPQKKGKFSLYRFDDEESAGITLARAFVEAGIKIPEQLFVKVFDKLS